ncbi:MAG TPA: periplasmic heavy metal sensor [Parvularculaceae bacterium]|nr:periplasmic heavy metal sensor [Parvularculaceae bacterium]
MRTGLVIALAVSLAANVLLGGFVAGRMIGGPPHEFFHGAHGHGRGGGAMMFGDLDALSPQAREAFRAVFKTHHDEMRGDFQEVMRLRGAFADALAADPWDRARAEKALADLRVVESKQQTALGAIMIDAFEKLSAADRKALIDSARDRRRAMDARRALMRGRHMDGDEPDARSPDDDDAPPPDGDR